MMTAQGLSSTRQGGGGAAYHVQRLGGLRVRREERLHHRHR